MDKKKLNLLFIIFCILLCMTLAGCKKDTIKFNHESKFNQVMNSVQGKKEEKIIKDKSGMIIYKDTSSSQSGINFGPHDINFGTFIKTKN